MATDIEILTRELISAFKTCDDTQFVLKANDGIRGLEDAVEKRDDKYQNLIRGATLSPRSLSHPASRAYGQS